jgi:hypothetical protein
MGLMIEDGGGSGKNAHVNNEGMLKVSAASASIEHHINHHHGTAYTMSFSQAPTANDDCILYVKNASDTDMVVEGFYLAVSAACEVYAEINNAGSLGDATSVSQTPVNVNAGSGLTAEGTFELGADLQAGTSTLATGNEVGRGVFTAASNTAWYNFNQDLILPKNKVLTLWCDTAGVTVTAMMEFNYHTDELG